MDGASVSPISAWTRQASPEALHRLCDSPSSASGVSQSKSALAVRHDTHARPTLIAPFRERSAPLSTAESAATKDASAPKNDPLNGQKPAAIAGTSQRTDASIGAAVVAGKPGTGSDRQRPTSHHAATSIAEAEAAVSAATAALADHSRAAVVHRSKKSAQLHQPAHMQPQTLQVQEQQQQQQHVQHYPPPKPFRHGPLKKCSSSTLNDRSSTVLVKVDDTLLSSLNVHSMQQPVSMKSPRSQAASVSTSWLASAQQHAAMDELDRRQAATATTAATACPVSVHGLQQQQQQLLLLHSQALLLQCGPDGEPLSAAVMMAAKAKSRRLRAAARGVQLSVQHHCKCRKPKQLKPLALNGALLLASTPGAHAARDVLVVDLRSSGISHIELSSHVSGCEAPACCLPSIEEATSKQEDAQTTAADGAAVTLAETSTSAGEEGASVATATAAPSVAGTSLTAVLSRQGMINVPAATAPPQLTAFSNLSALDLSDNHLSCIAGLAQLSSLVQLAVSANKLTSLQPLAVLNGSTCCSQKLDNCAAEAADTHTISSSSSSSGGGDIPCTTESCAPQAAAPHPDCSSTAAQGSGAAGQPEMIPGQLNNPSHNVFQQLQQLDVSYNHIPAEDLLGQGSPLAFLPRLSELHAAGNALTVLPAQLGTFSTLTQLDLRHNKLHSPALLPLAGLPVLQMLNLAHNPIKSVPGTVACTIDKQANNGTADFFARLLQLDLSHSKVAEAAKLQSLLQLPRLNVLQLVGTPLAMCCWSGTAPLQDLQKPGLHIVIQAVEPCRLWQHQCRALPADALHRRPAATARLLPVTVDDAVTCDSVLAAAGRKAITDLPHQMLVAAFNRVEDNIDRWQLAPVAEDSSGSWQQAQGGSTSSRSNAVLGAAAVAEEDEEVHVPDKTFITGVGITGELPENDDMEETAAVGNQEEQPAWLDPTERLAIALGLEVTQLAHHTHKEPVNPDAAIYKLRHALAHPLVDSVAGHQPQQHHTSMTVAAATKQRPRQLQPLKQPIPVALDTRIVQVQGIGTVLQGMRGRLQVLEGSLLQQLQAQAQKLMTGSSAAAESASNHV